MRLDNSCVKLVKPVVWRFVLAGLVLGVLHGTVTRCVVLADEPAAVKGEAVSKEEIEKRPVTVADVIRMTRVAGRGAINTYGGGLSAGFATFSPDGTRFVFLVKKGNLEQNTNEYSLLLYNADEVFDSPSPRRLVSFASSSNREAINDITWLADNRTILFLGEQPGETTQLYSVDCISGKIKQLTYHLTNLLEYSSSERGDRLVYAAERPVVDLVNASVLRNGFDVSKEWLSDLVAGHLQDHDPDFFVSQNRGKSVERLQILHQVDNSPISLSPDGRYLVVKTYATETPAIWRQYEDSLLQNVIRKKIPDGSPTEIPQYELVDIETKKSRVLLDSPVSYYGSEVAWASDSQSVILTGIYLPLDVTDPVERMAREKSVYVVEVKLPSLQVDKIAEHDLQFVGWEHKKQRFKLRARSRNGRESSKVEFFQRDGGAWNLVESTTEDNDDNQPDIIVEQDPNTPPRVVALNPTTGQSKMLLDLNPQFSKLALGRVECVRWTDGAGHEVTGGLYLPPDYVEGRKYPLVIQTHGFDSHAFWMDGPFSTAFAAQPLASKEIVVLQVPDSHDWSMRDTPQEAPRMMETYERAIEYLVDRGVVDPTRVGVIGFSQTCFYVQYFLTHSSYRIAAAVVADGLDGGYFSYVAFGNVNPYLKSVIEGLNGAAPYGKGLSLWLERSPGFQLERVRTPLRMQALHPSSILQEWEWFVGLSKLKKPVDLVYLPTGYHILQKPWDRMVSQQGDVDWFCFWLKGEEDSDPAKAQQYERWRHLRDLMN